MQDIHPHSYCRQNSNAVCIFPLRPNNATLSPKIEAGLRKQYSRESVEATENAERHWKQNIQPFSYPANLDAKESRFTQVILEGFPTGPFSILEPNG